jgi:hypothetical protein
MQAERLFKYRHTPKFYVFLIRLIDLIQFLAHEDFSQGFQNLCKANGVEEEEAVTLKTNVRELRSMWCPAYAGTPENHVIQKQHRESDMSVLVSEHLESVRDRLDREKFIAVERMAQALLMRYQAWPTNHKHKEVLKRKYDAFVVARDQGQYNYERPTTVGDAVSLFRSGAKVRESDALNVQDEVSLKRTKRS